MDLLPLNFQTLSYCGLWLEDAQKFVVLRKFWGYLLRTIILYFTLTEVIELYMLRNDVKEVVDIMFLTVTYICLCLKLLNFSIQKDNLKKLIQYFREDFYKATSSEEDILLQKYEIQHTKIFKYYLKFAQSTGMFLCLTPFLTLKPANYVAPFKTYQFYDDSTTIGFAVTCVIHFSALIFGIFINVSMDSMIYGFIITATGQFDLLSLRIMKAITNKDKNLFRQNILHHVHINETVHKIQQIFISAIVPQFILSLLTICASIFHIAQNEILSVEFLGFTMYLSCMLTQVFIYCWYGSGLNLMSQDIINKVCGCNWTVLDYKERKNLYFFLMFANKKCHISWKGQCSVSLETFVWIIKASYSAFSLLQRAYDN